MPDSLEATIRAAEPADCWALRQLLVEAYNARNTNSLAKVTLVQEGRDALVPLLDDPRLGIMLVAEIDDEICGTVSLFSPTTAGADIWRFNACGLRYLAITPRYRKKGISARLMAAAEQKATGLGAIGICAHLPYGTPGLISLFTSRGYARDPGGDVDRGSALYWDGYYLPLVESRQAACPASDRSENT